MKFKKLALVLVVVLMASAVAPAFAKNPFADVPADHWAYDSIVELAAAGLIEGYPDGTYGGSRMMTRYEAAMVFARALTRLEGQIAGNDVLAELDKVKAELTEEIKAQLAAMDKPVVETKIIEQVGGELDEATLARIRAAEVAAEALDGDIAYVEARVLGLIDGIRYDVNKLQEQVDAAVEQPSMEEIEALIAAKVQEGVLEAALSAKEVVKETTVVERVVATTPELTEKDVELIAENIIARQLQQYELLIVRALRENAEQNKRLDALEAAQADFASKEDVAGLAKSVKALEKVKFGGTLKIVAENEYDSKTSTYSYDLTQSLDLALNIKASDSVNVKVMANGKLAPLGATPFDISSYGFDLTSEGLVSRLLVGKKVVPNTTVNAAFGPYVLKNNTDKNYKHTYAAFMDLDIVEKLTGNVYLKTEAPSATEPVLAAFALNYKLSPAFGIKGAVVTNKLVDKALPEVDSFGGGIFGTIAKFDYTGDVVMDRKEETENLLFGGSLATGFGPLSLSGKYYQAQDNYGKGVVGTPFAVAGNKMMEFGADVEFLGIELGGAYYRELKGSDALVNSFKVEAAKDFVLGVPFAVSATYVKHTDEVTSVDNQHTTAKLAVGPEDEPDYGFFYGAALTYKKNAFASGGNWKNGKFSAKDSVTAEGEVKYITDFRGAKVDLGYAAEYKHMLKPDTDNNILTHNVDLGYGFTKDVKLTLGSEIVQTLATTTDNVVTYSAGLTVKF